MRIGVLFGGQSNEKEISLESGRNIVYKLDKEKFEVIPLFVNSRMEIYRISDKLLISNSTREIEAQVEQSTHVRWTDLSQLVEFIFIGLHGGAGENGSIQGMLEMLEIPYNGSGLFASALCMDKQKTKLFLEAQGFDVPKGILLSKTEYLTDPQAALTKLAALGLPLIVKPHDDGCSVLVQKANSENELAQALDRIFAQKQYALVETYITGMELTVGVIGNEAPRALPPSQAVAQAGILSIEEKFLPGAGENQTPAPLPTPALVFVQRTMEQIYKTIGCTGYARIDCFYQSEAQSPTGKQRVITLEINTLPGMTPATVIFHQAAELDISPTEFITMVTDFGLQAHAKRHGRPIPSSLTHQEGKRFAQ